MPSGHVLHRPSIATLRYRGRTRRRRASSRGDLPRRTTSSASRQARCVDPRGLRDRDRAGPAQNRHPYRSGPGPTGTPGPRQRRSRQRRRSHDAHPLRVPSPWLRPARAHTRCRGRSSQSPHPSACPRDHPTHRAGWEPSFGPVPACCAVWGGRRYRVRCSAVVPRFPSGL